MTNDKTPDQCSPEKYYGVSSLYCRAKGFIIQKGCRSEQFVTRCIEGITHGNGWDFSADTLQRTIALILENKNMRVYEFDTYQELLQWLLTYGK